MNLNFINKLLLNSEIDYNNLICLIDFRDISYLNQKMNFNILIFLLYFFQIIEQILISKKLESVVSRVQIRNLPP